MEFKVREIDGNEEKSLAEKEQEILDQHEQENENEVQEEVVETEQEDSLTEEKVLQFLGKRYGKEINSFDDIMSQREETELPEDVVSYLKYKKDTGS